MLTGLLQTIKSRATVVQVVEEESLDQSLRSFWELEEVPKLGMLSTDDEKVEGCFRETTMRAKDGRVTVALSFKDGFQTTLGLLTSRSVAVKQLLKNESHIDAKPDLKREYRRILEEYLKLGHMTRVDKPAV